MEVVCLLSENEMQEYLAARSRPVRPQPPYHLAFPLSLMKHAACYLQENGRQRLEQLVLWGGYPAPEGIVIASLLLPETEATWGWVHVLPSEQPKIAEWLRNHGQLLFVEAHTHGDGLGATDMSTEDRSYPAGRQEGFLTIIVPGYARQGIDFARAGVWECRGLVWTKIASEEAWERLRVVSDEEGRNALR